MARLPVDKARIHSLAGNALARYMRLVLRTSRIVIEPADVGQHLAANSPAIIALWHGQFMMAHTVKPEGADLKIILARHGDAEIFAQALGEFGIELIRGAAAGERQRDRGGAQALRQAIRALNAGSNVGVSADAPPGPARQAGLGLITLARMSGRPIIPLAVATSRYHSLNTWSRFTLNLPFSRLAGVFGAPITVSREADADEMKTARQTLERGLNAVTKRAYELAGADPTRATPKLVLDTGPAMPGASLKAYKAVTRLAAPAAPFLLAIRERRGREEPARRPERLGQASTERPAGELAWFHAASVGEANAALPVIDKLHAARPGLTCLLTTGTVTSAGIAARRLPPGDIHQYVPLDTPHFVNRFLDHWRPDLAVFTESEIWPNLILESSARAVPLALINARMSNRSYSRWRRFRGISNPLIGRFNLVLAQNEKLARRFRELGAPRCLPLGNLKADAPPPPVDITELARLRSAINGRGLLVAASTHEGEDRIIAEAHRAIARQLPGFLTVIAPRHPERGTEVAELMKSLGLATTQRSNGGALPQSTTDVYVADTMGELGTFYALAPIALIGGSLIERGGQNPIEAVQHGAAVLTGPHWDNFRDAYRALLRHRGAIEVKDAAELAAAVVRLSTDQQALAAMRDGGRRAVMSLSGALDRTVEELLNLMGARSAPAGDLRRVS